MILLDGKYEVLHKLSEGGMGTIYKVRHQLLDEIRVAKVMRPQVAAEPELRSRFLREAKLAIRVRHPNVVQLYDFSIDEAGSAVIVMEFIDGVTLQDVLRSGPPPSLPFVLEIALQILQALACLHASGIVHRDIASDNVMLTASFDGRPLVKVIDLGIAKGPVGGASATMTGAFLGKARYAAPEAFDGAGAGGLSPAADIYSFGVLLYELLTGRLPIEGTSFSELAAGHLFRAPVPFEHSDPDGTVPPELRQIIREALQKDPARRIRGAEAFAERLRALGGGGGAAASGAELDHLLARARTLRPASAGAHADAGSAQRLVDERAAPVPTPAAGPIATTPTPPPRVAPPAGSVPRARDAQRDALIDGVVDAVSSPSVGPDGQEILEVGGAHRASRAPLAEPTPDAGQRDARRRDAGGRDAAQREPRRRDGGIMPARSDRRVALLAAAVAAAVILSAAGIGLWIARSGSHVRSAEDVLGMPENTREDVDEKLVKMSGLLNLLDRDDERREPLERAKDRLVDLQELHKHADRLQRLLRDLDSAAGSDDLAKIETDATNIWQLLTVQRERLPADDPAAAAIEKRARAVLRDIGERIPSSKIANLADQR